ncbi:MAG: hypothetical protein QNJ77_02700 [Acidimicrobiia bacterium]|nr:hypothetical protein [Acidimicrobiia bacterium]
MTLLAVRPDLPQPDIGSVLEALAEHQSVELDCGTSPTLSTSTAVSSRQDLEDLLAERFPFRAHMAPVDDRKRVAVEIVLVDGPPISGDGDNLAEAIQSLLENALTYIEEWENRLRFDAAHRRYWGWVYRLLLAGDNDHIKSTLLGHAA